MSLLQKIAMQSAVSQAALLLAEERSLTHASTLAQPAAEDIPRKPNAKGYVHTRHVLSSPSTCISSSSSEGRSSGEHSEPSSSSQSTSSCHSRKRIDIRTVNPKHAKRLEKSRRYQEISRNVCALSAEINDDQLQSLLFSQQGAKRFPKTAAIFRQSVAASAAANAVKHMVEDMPPKAAHKQAIIGKLRGQMTAREFQDFFTSISDRYARKALQVARKQLEAKAAGEDPVKQDILSQKYQSDVEREKISVLESRITASVVREHLGAKSGSNAAFWFGTFDSFHKWFRTTAHPNIFAQMVAEAGGYEQLAVQSKGSKWVEENTEAYLCQGRCVTPGSKEVCHHNYKPRNRKTVGKILREQEVIFRCITKTVPCKWHDNWDRWKEELKREEAKEGSNRNAVKLKRLKEKLRKCLKHDAQYQVQRRSCAY